MAKVKPLTPEQFEALRSTLIERLTEALETELADCMLPELGSDPNSDLWDLPRVDSKTVAKLSPVVKDLIGGRLHPKWIKKGGYNSVEEAITDLVAQIGKHCVVGAADETTTQTHALAVTP